MQQLFLKNLHFSRNGQLKSCRVKPRLPCLYKYRVYLQSHFKGRGQFSEETLLNDWVLRAPACYSLFQTEATPLEWHRPQTPRFFFFFVIQVKEMASSFRSRQVLPQSESLNLMFDSSCKGPEKPMWRTHNKGLFCPPAALKVLTINLKGPHLVASCPPWEQLNP